MSIIVRILIAFKLNSSEAVHHHHNQHSMANYVNGIGPGNMYTSNGLDGGSSAVEDMAGGGGVYRNRHSHRHSNAHHPYYYPRPNASLRRLNASMHLNAAGLSSTTASANSQRRLHAADHHLPSADELMGGDLTAVAAAGSSATSTTLNVREMKYAAFGNFVASSLLDLPQNTALELVERFTSELVKALLQKVETTTASTNTTASSETTTANAPEVNDNTSNSNT